LVLFPFVSSPTALASSETVVLIYPVTSGFARAPATSLSHVLILAAQSNASLAPAIATARDMFQRGGITVVDESAALPPQETVGPQLLDRQDPGTRFLARGKQAGADHVLVLEITDTLVLDRQAQTTKGYLHDERVSVRLLGVQSGSIVFEGTARWSQPIERAGDHIRELTAYAIGRALCPADKWEEASGINRGRGRCRG
jgi:hypothetical protein